MVSDCHNGMGNSNGRSVLSYTSCNPSDFDESGTKILVAFAFAGFGGFSFACAFVMSWNQTDPSAEVTGTWKT
jgi:hypothetical protein